LDTDIRRYTQIKKFIKRLESYKARKLEGYKAGKPEGWEAGMLEGPEAFAF